MIMTVCIALAGTLLSLGLFYQSWKVQSLGFLWGGVGAFLVSVCLWSVSQGWEFGVVYGLCIPGVLVWPFILQNQVLLRGPNQMPTPRPVDFSRQRVLSHLGHYGVSLVLLMITSVLLSLTVSLRLPFTIQGQLATCIILIPLVWGGLLYHYFAVKSKPKAVALNLVVIAVCALCLLFLPAF
ncbi:hypothetical protein [Alteromonas sp. C1M14]|uniref:hypothetical protein n=1 Tax=Alteromonas sp. C1M14 TaxID=2841567 RepID=UPI001C0930CB|nr:hypothetical protein [Alteromonas sp. C1M14]MBU2977110.1 hypothetical protein [Alteromonas sp. C1M14]